MKKLIKKILYNTNILAYLPNFILRYLNSILYIESNEDYEYAVYMVNEMISVNNVLKEIQEFNKK